MKSWPSINVNTYDNKSLLVFSQRKKKKCVNNIPIYKKRELEVTGKKQRIYVKLDNLIFAHLLYSKSDSNFAGILILAQFKSLAVQNVFQTNK